MIQPNLIDPNIWYTTDQVSHILGRSSRTIARYCRTGRIASRRDPIHQRTYLIRGDTILAVLGDLAQTAAALSATETAAERRKRAQKAIDEIFELSEQGRKRPCHQKLNSRRE